MKASARWALSGTQVDLEQQQQEYCFQQRTVLDFVMGILPGVFFFFPVASGGDYFTYFSPKNHMGDSSRSAELVQNCLPGRKLPMSLFRVPPPATGHWQQQGRGPEFVSRTLRVSNGAIKVGLPWHWALASIGPGGRKPGSGSSPALHHHTQAPGLPWTRPFLTLTEGLHHSLEHM